MIDATHGAGLQGRHSAAQTAAYKAAACMAAFLCGAAQAAQPAQVSNCRPPTPGAQSAAQRTDIYAQRACDWRNGAVVYQVLVDRFVPSAKLDAKRALYAPPKRLRDWSETAQAGPYLPEAQLTRHELDFWGGDLHSLGTQLAHIQSLGAEVIYLNPIHLAYTNHKYDALDFQKISPEFGTRDDFRQLAKDVHARGMKVVLDGVFNHMGRNAPAFQAALKDAQSPWRNWFAIGPEFKGGARAWSGVQNLPELNLEHPPVRRHLYEAPDSVVRSYLRDGADGWRLDTAYELGAPYLQDLTRAAHREKPGSLVVGEIVNYPGDWLKSMDAVMNFTQRAIILGVVGGTLTPASATRMTERMVADSGIEPMLKSWSLLDNHDLPRVATQLPDAAQRRLAQVLQFTLPGAPNIYYGAEVGMVGGPDPENRSPMRWDQLRPDHPELLWLKQLVGLRQQHRALRVGDFRRVEAQNLMAFERHTNRALDSVIVLLNPSAEPVTERVLVANPQLMDDTPLHNLLETGEPAKVTVYAGFLDVTLPARSAWVLKPKERELGGYSRYKRVP